MTTTVKGLSYCATCGTVGKGEPSQSGLRCANCHSTGVWSVAAVVEQLIAAGVVAADGRVAVPIGRFSLGRLVAAQRRIEEVSRDRSFVHPFSDEQLAIMSYALAVLSAERLAAGEQLAQHDRLPTTSVDTLRRAAGVAADVPLEDGEEETREQLEALIEQLDEELCYHLHRGDELGEHSPETHLALARKLRAVFDPATYPPLAGGDPPGDSPVELWREWCSRDISETDDGWATFTNRVHDMLKRRGIQP